MANQSVGTPRFYLDFTQLAKAKGFRLGDGQATSLNLTPEDANKNLNVWDFDYTNPTRYTVAQDSVYFSFYCPPFWDISDSSTANLEWAKLMSKINWVGAINHNLYYPYKRFHREGKIFPYHYLNYCLLL